jgi:hypothetical protein
MASEGAPCTGVGVEGAPGWGVGLGRRRRGRSGRWVHVGTAAEGAAEGSVQGSAAGGSAQRSAAGASPDPWLRAGSLAPPRQRACLLQRQWHERPQGACIQRVESHGSWWPLCLGAAAANRRACLGWRYAPAPAAGPYSSPATKHAGARASAHPPAAARTPPSPTIPSLPDRARDQHKADAQRLAEAPHGQGSPRNLPMGARPLRRRVGRGRAGQDRSLSAPPGACTSCCLRLWARRGHLHRAPRALAQGGSSGRDSQPGRLRTGNY